MGKDSRPTLFEQTKHPLIVLAFSTILGSALIPYVGSRLARETRRAELRASHVVEALQSSARTDRQLNLLITEFGNFVKDESITDQIARTALRGRIYSLYADFNRDAWWWHWQLLQEAQVLQLVNGDETRAMRVAIEEYGANLQKTTQAIDPLWGALLSARFDAEPRRVESLFAESNSRARMLQQQRQEVVARMLRPLRD
jgi:hypothetical protein